MLEWVPDYSPGYSEEMLVSAEMFGAKSFLQKYSSISAETPLSTESNRNAESFRFNFCAFQNCRNRNISAFGWSLIFLGLCVFVRQLCCVELVARSLVYLFRSVSLGHRFVSASTKTTGLARDTNHTINRLSSIRYDGSACCRRSSVIISGSLSLN